MSLSQHGSIQNLLGQSMSSINTNQQELLLANFNLPGLRIDGRMSAVRRFFCLFVTFDLLFTSLFWIICVLIDGQTIRQGLNKEILNYSFQTSMFDLVVCSAFRFSLLLLCYAIIYIHHYWMVAVTTLLSSAFLVTKSLLYQWGGDNSNTSSTSYPFQVLLLLLAFLLAWAEAWFIDFSVLPQEERAKKLQALQFTTAGNIPTSSHTRISDYLSQCPTESVANFYSPMQSPYESEDEETDIKKLDTLEKKFLSLGVDAVLRAYDLLNFTGWQVSSQPNVTDVIHTTIVSGRKIYKICGPLQIPAEIIFRDSVENIETMPLWNKAIAAVRKVQTITSNCDIIHQIAADVPGGIINSRDFVMSRHWRTYVGTARDNWSACYVSGGISVVHPECPVNKQFTRGENGPGCWAFYSLHNNTTFFHWIFDTDLKGWLPKSIVDSNISSVMVQQLQSLRTHCQTLITNGLELPSSSVEDSWAGSLNTSHQFRDDELLLNIAIERGLAQSVTTSISSNMSAGLDNTTQSLPPVNFRDCQ